MQQQLKILFVGDASNFHFCLAGALRQLGHNVTLVSDGGQWMDTERDINLSRGAGRIGTIKYVIDILKLLPKLRGYDIVHIISPIFFVQLRLDHSRHVFDYLKKHNRYIFLSATTTDYYYVKACLDGKTFRYSDYRIGEKPSPYALSQEAEPLELWNTHLRKWYSEYTTKHLDGIVACLYEYYKSYENIVPHRQLAYGGIPIDTKSVKPRLITKTPDKIKFFLGRKSNRIIMKGSDLLLDALRRTCDRYPKLCEMQVVENVPYKDYVELLSSAHVNLDQLYSYTPATNALLGMAMGIIAVSGAEPEYYDFIGEHQCRPIINVSPVVEKDIDDKLAWIVEHRDVLPTLSLQSREFVEKHNDSIIVARRHLEFWSNIMSPDKK